jgi:hypothetical protein
MKRYNDKKEIILFVINDIISQTPKIEELLSIGMSHETAEVIQNDFFVEIIDESISFINNNDLKDAFRMVDLSYLSCGSFFFFDFNSIDEDESFVYFGRSDVFFLCEEKLSKEILIIDRYDGDYQYYLAPNIITFLRTLPILCQLTKLSYLNQYDSEKGLNLYNRIKQILVEEKYLEYYDHFMG